VAGRARPTLRCLREDLGQAVPPADTPLDEVPHPLVAKASERFATILSLIPGCQLDAWMSDYAMPERAVAPEEQVWSNMMDPAAAAKLLEEDSWEHHAVASRNHQACRPMPPDLHRNNMSCRAESCTFHQ
jgi:hypothetical protein